MQLLKNTLERYLVFWLVGLSAVAFYWPALGIKAFDPFLVSNLVVQLLIAVTMLAIGSLLSPGEVRGVARHWPTVIGGTATQYAVMPLLAYLVALLFGFEGPILLGVIMVGCVPGAMASNVLTLAARGNVSYSVSLTTLATLLSPIAVPFAMWLTIGQVGDYKEKINFIDVSLNLALTVVIPVIVGFTFSRVSHLWRRGAIWSASTVANLSILYIIAVVVGRTRDYLSGVSAAALWIVVALLLINLGGYLAGNLSGRAMRLDDRKRRALTLEIGMQNAGVGTWLVLNLVGKNEPAAAIPTALYTFGCMLTGTILARIWAAKKVGSKNEE